MTSLTIGTNVASIGDYQSGIAPHSGNYEAALLSYGGSAYLSQSLSTSAGASYLLSFWFDNPYASFGSFLVSWNGKTILDTSLPDANTWTNLQFMVLATGPGSVLQFGFDDEYGDYCALDDVSVLLVQPSIASLSLSGTNLVFSGGNGPPGATYKLLMSTNLALPLNHWTSVATNVFNASGNFTITATNSVSRAVAQGFYILHTQ